MSLIAGNLGVVQRILDGQKMLWGVCAGAAAHLYGDRRPIQDIDILVGPGQLPTVVNLLLQNQKAVQFDGTRILWRGIKIFSDLSVKRNGTVHPFVLDAAMAARLRRLPLLGSTVAVLSPEDVLLHKVLLGRGADQGKSDLIDAVGIAKRHQMDCIYLRERMEAMHSNSTTMTALAQLGITF